MISRRSRASLQLALICETVNDDGTMARGPDLVRFCEKHGLITRSPLTNSYVIDAGREYRSDQFMPAQGRKYVAESVGGRT